MIIEFQKTSAIIIAVLIPVLILALTIITIILAKKEEDSWIHKVARFLREPFNFKRISKDADLLELPETETRPYSCATCLWAIYTGRNTLCWFIDIGTAQ